MRLDRCIGRIGLACVLSGFWHLSAAVQIDASFEEISAGSWQVDYRILNDNLPSLAAFTIFFPAADTHTLAVVSTNANWDLLVIQPDQGIPDDGFVDGLAKAAGLVTGATLDLTMTFGSTSQFSPAPQRFEIRNPDTFQLIDSGFTTVTVVPEPASASLLLVGALALLALCRRWPVECKGQRIADPRAQRDRATSFL